MKVRIYKYKTDGIYKWGRGFVSGEVADKWHEFWEYVAANGRTPNTGRTLYHWRILRGDIGCDILVDIGGSIYLHPMSGCGVVQVINEISIDEVYGELFQLMDACAKYIGNGALVEMYSSKIRTVKE